MLGAEPAPFIGLTVVLFGLAAVATGRALADTWRPAWQIAPATLLLTMTDLFLLYALFDARLAAPGGFAAAAILGLIMAAAYYYARARKMVQQYPWLYERSGPFGWRAKGPHTEN